MHFNIKQIESKSIKSNLLQGNEGIPLTCKVENHITDQLCLCAVPKSTEPTSYRKVLKSYDEGRHLTCTYENYVPVPTLSNI